MVNIIVCKYCLTEIDGGGKFCPSCGARVEEKGGTGSPFEAGVSAAERRELGVDRRPDEPHNGFAPGFEETLNTVPPAMGGTVSGYAFWDEIPENERLPQVSALAARYPLKKHRGARSKAAICICVFFYSLLILAFCAFGAAAGVSDYIYGRGDWPYSGSFDGYYYDFGDIFDEYYDYYYDQFDSGNFDADDFEEFFDEYFGNNR